MRPSAAPDGVTCFPCSSRAYHVGLIRAISATSSRRRPDVLRLLLPACLSSAGLVAASRCLRRNSPSARCRTAECIVGYFVPRLSSLASANFNSPAAVQITYYKLYADNFSHRYQSEQFTDRCMLESILRRFYRDCRVLVVT